MPEDLAARRDPSPTGEAQLAVRDVCVSSDARFSTPHLKARSIAHGCASTIRRFIELHEKEPGKYEGWGLSSKNFPPTLPTWSEAFKAWKERERTKGECWLRPGCTCPFSRKALEAVKPDLEPALIDEVSKIYELCPQLKTQLRKV